MRRREALLAAVLIGLSGLSAAPVQAQQAAPPAGASVVAADQLVYFGTRAAGPGNGITAARFDPRTGHLTGLGLAAEIERPTWVIPSPHRAMVYSVSEVGNDGKTEASVYSFASDKQSGKLTQVSKVSSGGGGATHLYVDGKSHALMVANYGGGQVSVIPVQQGGVLLPATSVQQQVGTGPHVRQKSAHPHAVIVDPSGRFMLSADLGADKIFIYRLDPAALKLTPADPAFVTAKPGSGPRHLAFHPNGQFLYANSELTGEITSYRWDGKAGRLAALKTISALPAGYTGERSAGELALSRDGRFAYVSNRGEDTVVVYAVNAKTGDLKEIQRIASGGKSPWAFSPDPTGRWFAVANEGSDLVSIFKLDQATGRLTATSETLSIPHPSSVAFLVK